MPDFPYVQATEANRLKFLTTLGVPSFQLEFIPSFGPLPATWNSLGDWFIVSRSGPLTGVSAQGRWVNGLPMLISTPHLTFEPDTGTFVNQDIYIRTRPWIPDGTIRFTLDLTVGDTTNIPWALALGFVPP